MGRLERRIFQLNDEIAALRDAETLAREELIMHQHIDDDAQRDAAVSDAPIDRADAAETRADVARARSVVEGLIRKREKLEAKRDRLISKLS